MMFARTERLLLRPGWIEDAPALAGALNHVGIASAVAMVPHPYTIDDAHAFLMEPVASARPRLLVFARSAKAPELIGGIGLRDAGGVVSLGYWIRPDRWGCGYATEAGRAMIAIADMLGVDRLMASHFIDNPASGAVLGKLGFRPSGAPTLVRSAGRPADARHMIRTLHAEPADQPLAA